MSNTKFKKVWSILERNDLGTNFRNLGMFDKLNEEDVENESAVKSIVDKIKAYEDYLESGKPKYSENIMRYLRQRGGLDEYDFSQDNQFDELPPEKVFEEVVKWNGLSGEYHSTIINWVEEIFKVKLVNE